MWFWVLIAIICLAALFVFILSLPLNVTLRLEIGPKPKVRVRISWLFGLVVREINRWEDIEWFLKVRKSPMERPRVVGRFQGDFKIGLGNPAITGFLFGFIYPALAFVNVFAPFEIRVQPSFNEPAFEGYFSETVRLQPFRLLRLIPRFAFSLSALRAIKLLVMGR